MTAADLVNKVVKAITPLSLFTATAALDFSTGNALETAPLYSLSVVLATVLGSLRLGLVVGFASYLACVPLAPDQPYLVPWHRTLNHVLVLASFALIALASWRWGTTFSRARRRAVRDPLTDLYNRFALLDAVDDMLTQQRRTPGTPFSLIYIDIDGFKHVNDEEGHAAGDRLLIETGNAIRTFTRQSDLVARLGGDEFVILAQGADEATAVRVAQSLATRLEERFLASHRIGFSFGVATSLDGSRSAHALLEESDRKMYTAKHLRRSG